MPTTLRRQQGFSLPEVMLAMVLLMMVVTALSGYQRELSVSLTQLAQYRQLWRYAWQQTQLPANPLPGGWQVNRVQTTAQRCVSISATITTPTGRQGTMTRLHCPANL